MLRRNPARRAASRPAKRRPRPGSRRRAPEQLEDRRLLVDNSAAGDPAVVRIVLRHDREAHARRVHGRLRRRLDPAARRARTRATSPSATTSTTASTSARAGNPTLYGTETGIKTLADDRPPRRHRLPRRLRPEPQRLLRHRRRRVAQAFKNAGGYPGLLPRVAPATSTATSTRAFELRRRAGPARGPDRHRPREEPPAHPQPRPRLRQQHPRRHDALERPARQRPQRDEPPLLSRSRPARRSCVFDPITGEQNIPVYPFNTANPHGRRPGRGERHGLPDAQRAVAGAGGRRRRPPHRRGQARRGLRARLLRPRRLPREPAHAARRQHQARLQLQRGLRRQRRRCC